MLPARQLPANRSPTARQPLVSHSPAAHKLLPLANPPAARHRTPAADWLPAAHQLLASMLLSPTARQPLANRSRSSATHQRHTSTSDQPCQALARQLASRLPLSCTRRSLLPALSARAREVLVVFMPPTWQLIVRCSPAAHYSRTPAVLLACDCAPVSYTHLTLPTILLV